MRTGPYSYQLQLHGRGETNKVCATEIWKVDILGPPRLYGTLAVNLEPQLDLPALLGTEAPNFYSQEFLDNTLCEFCV